MGSRWTVLSYHHRASACFLPFPSCFRPLMTSTAFDSPRSPAMSPRQSHQISLYADALLHWNQKMNLTAAKEVGEVMRRHVDDSLAIVPVIEKHYTGRCGVSSDGISLIDVGSGPGLPGIIIAIACPRQNAGQGSEYREVFDVAVARAVAEMRILAEYCLPLVRVGGLFVAAKGHDPQDEINNAEKAVRLMGASMLELCSVESQGPYGRRTAAVYLKDRPTPKKYPRQPGIPSKTPL